MESSPTSRCHSAPWWAAADPHLSGFFFLLPQLFHLLLFPLPPPPIPSNSSSPTSFSSSSYCSSLSLSSSFCSPFLLLTTTPHSPPSPLLLFLFLLSLLPLVLLFLRLLSSSSSSCRKLFADEHHVEFSKVSQDQVVGTKNEVAHVGPGPPAAAPPPMLLLLQSDPSVCLGACPCRCTTSRRARGPEPCTRLRWRASINETEPPSVPRTSCCSTMGCCGTCGQRGPSTNWTSSTPVSAASSIPTGWRSSPTQRSYPSAVAPAAGWPISSKQQAAPPPSACCRS